MSETMWIEFDSNDIYAQRVSIRRDCIAAVIDAGTMDYNDSKQPEGVRRITMIYTTGGNAFPVKATREEVLAIFAGKKSHSGASQKGDRER